MLNKKMEYGNDGGPRGCELVKVGVGEDALVSRNGDVVIIVVDDGLSGLDLEMGW